MKPSAKNKHAVALGRLGGKAKSPAKAEAARTNGGKRRKKAVAAFSKRNGLTVGHTGQTITPEDVEAMI